MTFSLMCIRQCNYSLRNMTDSSETAAGTDYIVSSDCIIYITKSIIMDCFESSLFFALVTIKESSNIYAEKLRSQHSWQWVVWGVLLSRSHSCYIKYNFWWILLNIEPSETHVTTMLLSLSNKKSRNTTNAKTSGKIIQNYCQVIVSKRSI